MKMTKYKLFVSVLVFVFCHAPVFAENDQVVKDPLEPLNRKIFAFNDAIDQAFLKPLASFYNKVLPKAVNQGIHNFFNNLNTVTTVANDLLQLHLYQGLNDLWRLGINSTIGIGGLFDVAGRIGLKPYSNDFGLTLAHYGWRNSTFIVWPFFGPSSLRDGVEIPIDYYYLSVYPYVEPDWVTWSLYGLGVVDRRAQLLKYQSVMEEIAIDKYSFLRFAYSQKRQFQILENEKRGFITATTETKEAKSKETLNQREIARQKIDEADFPTTSF